MEDFDTEINPAVFRNVSDSQSATMKDLFGGVTATAVDFGASVWNSLPLTPEVDTADLLKKVNNDALRIYEQDPDLIHTASFVGGMFVPAGLAVKGMGAARAGVKGVNWFSKAGKEADMLHLEEMFKAGGAATKEYRNAKRAMYAKNFGNEALDAIAAEAAIVGTMNAHPLMEDYMEDPVKNFAIGAVAGGVLGGTAGTIADHFTLRSALGAIEAEALKGVLDQSTAILPNMTSITSFQKAGLNVKNLDNMLELGRVAGKDVSNSLDMQIATRVRDVYAKTQEDIFTEMVSPKVLEALDMDQTAMLKRMLENNEALTGVESIGLLSASQIGSANKKYIGALTSEPVLSKQTLLPSGIVKEEDVKAVMFPGMNVFGTTKDLRHYAPASALSTDTKFFSDRLGKQWGRAGDDSHQWELLEKTSADIQGDYIGAMVKVAQMSENDLKKLHVSESDGPLLNAVLAKLRSDPELAANVKIRVGAPIGGKATTKKIVSQETKALDANGMPDDFAVKLTDNFNEGTIRTYGADAQTVKEWTGGKGMSKYRHGAYLYDRVNGGAGYAGSFTHQMTGADQQALEAFTKAYNSGEKARQKLKEIADVDGYIYLYRGTSTNKLQGQAALESMTTNFGKAQEFARRDGGVVSLYKVKPEDVAFIVKDFGGKSDQTEFVVKVSAREPVSQLSSSGNLVFSRAQTGGTTVINQTTIINSGGTTVPEFSYGELTGMLWKQKQNAIQDLVGEGVPFESIALRTNTPVDTVKLIAMTKGQFTVEDLATQMGPAQLTSIFDNVTAQQALDPMTRPLLLEGNVRKNAFAEAHSKLDQKQLQSMNDDAVESFLLSSKNATVRKVGKFLFDDNSNTLAVIRAELANAVNTKGGNPFFNSFDFLTRNMESLGPAFSYIGKQMGQFRNDLIQEINLPVARGAEAILKEGTASVVEFNTFKQLNDTLSGWRTFDKGQLWQKVMKQDSSGKMVEVLEAVKYGGKEFVVRSDAVIKLISDMQGISQELKHLANAGKKIVGAPDVNDIGLWIPTFNPVGKHITYLHDMATDKTSLIWAHSAAELATAEKVWESKIIAENLNAKLVRKGTEQELWSKLNGRLDPIHMTSADTSKLKSGSAAPALPAADANIFAEIAGGYQHYISSQMRTLTDMSLSDITGNLRVMSQLNTWGKSTQPLTTVQKITQKDKDIAQTMLNNLIGEGSMAEYQGWKSVNQSFETGLSYVMNGAAKAYDSTLGAVLKRSKGDVSKIQTSDYEAYAAAAKKAGMFNPFETFDAEAAKMFGLAKLEDHPDTSKRAIYASNALAATAILRFGDLAQPLVNMLSMPILGGLAIADRMPAHFMGVAKGTASVMPGQVMAEGIRAMNSPLWKRFDKIWEDAGFFKPLVSEANDTLQAARSFNKGAIASIEKALDSKFVEVMSKPADYAEALSRRTAMYTGATLAKRLYPELDDNGITIFARNFMDKAIGNFHASQRPVFFQGTLGVALGLFQTYALTLMQNVYRGLELKNYKALGKAALTQSALFGTSSLPGFSAVSEQIGEHFSDDNVDLTTGTYRALPDSMADMILYGLPSNLGPGIHTRGDADIRFPGLSGDNIVALNFAKQVTAVVGGVAQNLQSDSPDVGRALLQGLSLQSVSRPIARLAEVGSGYSVTQQGNTVQTPEEVWTFTGIASRALATRPLEETKLREAMHLNSYYGSIDREAREKATNKIRTAIRNETLTEDKISSFAEEYMRHGGTASGWRSALQTAIAKTDTNGKEHLLEKLKPDNPLNFMLESLD